MKSNSAVLAACALASVLLGCGGGGDTGGSGGGGTGGGAGGGAGGPKFAETRVAGRALASYGGNLAVVTGETESGGKLVSFDLTDVDGTKATVAVSPALPSSAGGYSVSRAWEKLALLTDGTLGSTYLGATGELLADRSTTFLIVADGRYVYAPRWDGLHDTAQLFPVDLDAGTLGTAIDVTGKGTLESVDGGKALFKDDGGAALTLYQLPGMAVLGRYPALGPGYGGYGDAALSGGGVVAVTNESWGADAGGAPINPAKVVYFAPGSTAPQTLYESKMSGGTEWTVLVRAYDEAQKKVAFTVYKDGDTSGAFWYEIATGKTSSLPHDYVWKPGLRQAYRWDGHDYWLSRVTW